MKSVKPIPKETCKFFLADIIIGLEALHEQDFCHRDLKPANILLNENYRVRLCDFGEAKKIEDISREQLKELFDDFMKKQEKRQ